MMKDADDIRDDEIRVLSKGMLCDEILFDACCSMESKIEEAPKPSSNQSPSSNRLRTITILSILLVLAIIFAIILSLTLNRKAPQIEETIFENEVCYCCSIEKRVEMERHRLGRIVDKDIGGFCEIQSIYINDIPFEIYIPHNATMSLCVGSIDHNDKDIVYATQAADVRADNGGIVGAFVLKGKPLAWGLSKKGYCASIDGNVYVGVAENSPLFEEATEKDGYFFRQYPLVKDGIPVHNNLRGKSIRRAICERNGEIFMVATSTPESFHDFIQALVDFGIDQAVYLVGSSAIGWAVNEDGTIHEWDDKETILGDKRLKNISYIVWKKNK